MRQVENPARPTGAQPEAFVRPLRRTDLEMMHEIHALCLTRSLMSHYSMRQVQAWMRGRTPMDYWIASETGENFRVVEVAEVTAGYASWRGDELLSLFVAPIAQGHGLGKMLFQTCALDAAAAGTPLARVHATLNATGFFRRLGFHPAEQGFDEKNGERIPYMLMRGAIDRSDA